MMGVVAIDSTGIYFICMIWILSRGILEYVTLIIVVSAFAIQPKRRKRTNMGWEAASNLKITIQEFSRCLYIARSIKQRFMLGVTNFVRWQVVI